ncbi:hypothetical protein GCM10022198_04270 [Klugiella xanthotipulae]|uniref:Leucine rich repeat (LRR) protein n=1 Tax=Klugiella xanthotipulae TaxID=244735 RepID=A0A543HSJ8_9MICO|nr:hypothetical protein [Klugiella xanthotipulae]TQM61315.1 hypothetical protein FB466_2264 [Klugiella xanthotipulae]
MTDDPIEAALARHVGPATAADFTAKVSRYVNYPNLIKGIAKMPAAPDLEAAALALIDDSSMASTLGLDSSPVPGMDPTLARLVAVLRVDTTTLALLTLAARADIEVVDRVAGRLAHLDWSETHLATIRRSAARHRAAGRSATAAPAPQVAQPDAPQRISEVKAWLSTHGDGDLGVLAPYEKQKATARLAAIRALGQIATPQALEVLGQYACESYPDKVLDELHKAWGRFDRRDFAATMFRQAPWRLDLGFASSIEGIGAVSGLTSLKVGFCGPADLSPLAECTGLTTLWAAAQAEPGLLSVAPLLGLTELTELHLNGTTHNADLTQLATLPVRRLELNLDGEDCSFLMELPRLERLLLSGAVPGETTNDVIVALVRKGVQVVVSGNDTEWVTGLRERAEWEAGVFLVAQRWRIGFVNDESELELLERRLFSNILL